MILVDSATGSRELLPIIQRIGEEAKLQNMEYGDFVFSGNGPHGEIDIGIERKALHDMLHCIDDARLAGFQSHGMRTMFKIRIVILEGFYKPHDNEGILMESRDGYKYWPCKYRTKPPLYSKLYNYILSLSLSGLLVIHSRDPYQTAFNVVETYRYFQKKWTDHTAMQEIQTFALSEVMGRPSLCRRWAAQVDGIGVKLSADVDRQFRTGRMMALASPSDWASIRGLSMSTAERIVSEIWGR